jgi:hypothetical protein
MDIINLKIDVKKITKSRLYAGEKGTYLSCSLIPTPQSEYGDYMIVESVTKSEREQGVKGVILGNGKVFVKPGSSKPEAKPDENGKYDAEGITKDDDMPF